MFMRVRNLNEVSRQLGIPTPTLHTWKKEDDWDGKMERNKVLLANAQQVLVNAESHLQVAESVTELRLLEFLEGKIAELLLTEDVRPANWKDVLDTLKFIRTERRMLTGEPTSRQENIIDTTALREKDIDGEIEKLKAIVDRPLPPKKAVGDGTDNG